jgi:DNA helicase HerA-like ATPase
MLDDKGMPGIVQRAFMLPPTSQIGPVTPAVRQQIIQSSPVFGRYEKTVDRESAYEKLTGRVTAAGQAGGLAQAGTAPAGKPAKGGKPEPTALDQVMKVANSPMARQIERELVRGLMGSLLGTGRRR